MKNKKTIWIGSIVGLIVLIVLLAIVLVVFYQRRQQSVGADTNVAQQEIEDQLNDLDPESDFEPFELDDLDPDLDLTVEEDVEYTLESIDSLIEDLESDDFGSFDDISW